MAHSADRPRTGPRRSYSDQRKIRQYVTLREESDRAAMGYGRAAKLTGAGTIAVFAVIWPCITDALHTPAGFKLDSSRVAAFQPLDIPRSGWQTRQRCGNDVARWVACSRQYVVVQGAHGV